MARRIRSAAMAMFVLAASPAFAGDFAERAVIGFSPDGSHFGFEEFGVQDGSGFPYANVYVIDVDRDAWVDDSPKQSLIRHEDATVEDARGEARQQARFLVQQYDLSHAGTIVASRLYTDESADPYKIVFRPRSTSLKSDAPMMLTLDQYKLEDKPLCKDVGGSDSKGFRLTLTSDGASRVLHEDKRLPSSRTCPLEYRIHDVVTYYPEGAAPVLVIIIQMLRVGFEGPDGRFLAVTTRF